MHRSDHATFCMCVSISSSLFVVLEAQEKNASAKLIRLFVKLLRSMLR